MRRQSSHSLLIIFLSLLLLFLLSMLFIIPTIAENTFGVSDPSLSLLDRFFYSVDLLWYSSDLIKPLAENGEEILFVIQPGEYASSIATNLEKAGLIRNARIFRVYLRWTGKDALLQSGTFLLSASFSAVDIAEMLQSVAFTEIYFTILPGWRLEEVAASLPVSGLPIPFDEFMRAAAAPLLYSNLIPAGKSAEGYLFPETYILPRTTTADQLVSVLVQGFSTQISSEYVNIYSMHGLSLHEAVTLASIIEKEAIMETEMPLIASVFYNRMEIGMKLQTDPTVQYALGYDPVQATWWTTPLDLSDLEVDSPYNTYKYPGLPPGPICNPGWAALQAVAYPDESPYYYFQAKCDGSGFHNFAETYEQHLMNNCP